MNNSKMSVWKKAPTDSFRKSVYFYFFKYLAIMSLPILTINCMSTEEGDLDNGTQSKFSKGDSAESDDEEGRCLFGAVMSIGGQSHWFSKSGDAYNIKVEQGSSEKSAKITLNDHASKQEIAIDGESQKIEVFPKDGSESFKKMISVKSASNNRVEVRISNKGEFSGYSKTVTVNGSVPEKIAKWKVNDGYVGTILTFTPNCKKQDPCLEYCTELEPDNGETCADDSTETVTDNLDSFSTTFNQKVNNTQYKITIDVDTKNAGSEYEIDVKVLPDQAQPSCDVFFGG